MKSHSLLLRAVLRFATLAVAVLASLLALHASSVSAASSGHTGQALALRALLHPGKTASAFLAQPPRYQRLPNGRILLPNNNLTTQGRKGHAVGGAPTLINEGVQTFDLFSPPPTFQTQSPAGPLTPTNLYPVWSSDERYIVFSSNLDITGKGVAADGHFHIYAASASGGGVVQITSGKGNEFYPALNVSSNALAFTSDTLTAGTQNLYIIGGQSGVPFSPETPGLAPIDVSTLTSATNQKTTTNTEFGNVQRPTWSPGSDRLAFSATTLASTTGHTPNVNHIYFLYVSNNGFQPQPPPNTPNPPAALTDGSGNDTDPAWSPDGSSIAFASTATAIAGSGQQISPTTAPTRTSSGTVGGQRGIYLLNGGSAAAFGVPEYTANGGRVTVPGNDDFAPAWSADTPNQYFNPNGTLEYLSFARGTAQNANHDIYYFRLLNLASGSAAPITPETTGGNNDGVKLNTDDNDGQGNNFNDTYPTWAPFTSIFSIAYQSPRSVTYDALGTNAPLETAVSLPQGTGPVGTNYVGILESQVLNLDPPTLLRYNGNQVVRVQDPNGNETRNIQPSIPGSPSTVTFTVRLSNREAGIDDNKVFLQIKDPDSKYQDSQGLEHKVFARLNEGADSGTASFALANDGGFAGFNIINGNPFFQNGTVAGVDGGDTISVGHSTSTNPTLNTYLPWGPEYECQFVNPTIANPSTGPTDYGTPYYLAGVDDQQPFIGLFNPPRPTADTTDLNTGVTTPAQYLPLTRLPDAQQDGQGGVLYQAKYQTPNSPSDFYLDVIAYDKAQFPIIQPTGGSYTNAFRKFNFRIYDNVGGFTTATFNGSNDILVVSDNALGQKFAATTFGGSSRFNNNSANLVPTFYGAESYFTDIDVSLLPNAVDFTVANAAPKVPPIPQPDPTSTTPSNLMATPGTAQITLTWAGVLPVPTSYNIYRSTTNPNPTPGGAGVTLIATIPGNGQTSYLDKGLTNGTTYYYVVTALYGTNETGPSNTASATPQDFTKGPNHLVQILSSTHGTGFTRGFSGFEPNVLNGLGVGSYNDGFIDDRGRVSAVEAKVPANMPADVQAGTTATGVVPFVRSQKYSIWRILSRGAISQTVLAAYQPTFQSQPAVADATNNVNAPAAPNVTVANRCVIWISPYTGDLPLIDAGSLENPTTQTTLQSFVNAGGRFFLSGQDVANALTLGGTKANTFVSNVLNAAFASDAGGSTSLAGNGGRISGEASINQNISLGFETFQGDAGYHAGNLPNGAPLLLGNNQGANNRPNPPNWRADGSQDQIGPLPIFFGNSSALGRIDTITPLNGATVDMTTGGNPGLIYNANFTAALNQGFGSRVVFSSFGLEGIGIEYYKVNLSNPTETDFVPRNQRPNLLHNIVNYLRTGTFTGRITQASGQGVANATVYLRPNGGTLPGPRQVFSATTDFNGNYTIGGVDTGFYNLTAYKSGFSTSSSNVAEGVEGDTTNNFSLVIAPTPPGRIQGTVTDNSSPKKNPISGAAITFVSADKQTTLTAVSGPDGTYTIDNVPAGSYTGQASKKPQFGNAAPVQADPTTGFITVPSGGTAPADFVLMAQPATLTGIVFLDANGDGTLDNGETGIAGASVSLVPSAKGGTAPAAVTTGADGSYTITGIAPGSYTLSVTKTGFTTNASPTLTFVAGDAQTRNVPLIVAVIPPNGTLGGLVQTTFNSMTLGGATVTITDSTGTVAATATTTSATTSPAASAGGDGAALNYGPVSLPAGLYTVTVTDSGYSTQSQANLTVTSGAFTRADFTVANGLAPAPIHVFPAGLNFFSVPYNYSAAGVSFDSLLGSLNSGTISAPSSGSNRSHIYVYDPSQLQYILDPTPPADAPRLGQGYWVYLLNAHAVTATAPVAGTSTISVALKAGWNMIGVPSVKPISVSGVSGLQFPNAAGGGNLDFAAASSSMVRLISGTLYGYNGTGYVPITAGGTLAPYQSYWIYAYVNTTVLIPTQ